MIKEFLESVNLFYDVNEDIIKDVAPLCKIKNYPKNSMIILEEEYGDQLFIVKNEGIVFKDRSVSKYSAYFLSYVFSVFF